MTQKIVLVYENSSAKSRAVHSVPSHVPTMGPPHVFSERDVLMQLLSSCLPLVEAASATTALLASYDSFADVVAAPFNELQDTACLGEQGAHLLKCVHTAAIYLAAVPLQRTATVNDWSSLSAYLNTSLARERNEVVRVLFLNVKNHVISDQVLAQGTTNFVNVSVRDIAQKSLQLGATSILILHNHPSGDPTPSEEDLDMTQILENALTPLGVCLHDHIIAGKGRSFSIKKMKFIYQDSDYSTRPLAAA